MTNTDSLFIQIPLPGMLKLNLALKSDRTQLQHIGQIIVLLAKVSYYELLWHSQHIEALVC